MQIEKLRIYVAGIPTRLTKENILGYFREFGPISSVETFVHSEGKSSRIKGYCVLTTTCYLTYSQILEQPKHLLFGRSILCAKYQEGTKLMRQNRLNNQRRIILRGVAASTSLEDLQRHLYQILGPIEVIYEFKEDNLCPGNDGQTMHGTKAVSVSVQDKALAQQLIATKSLPGIYNETYWVSKFKPTAGTHPQQRATPAQANCKDRSKLGQSKETQHSAMSTAEGSIFLAHQQAWLQNVHKPSCALYFDLRRSNHCTTLPVHREHEVRFNRLPMQRAIYRTAAV